MIIENLTTLKINQLTKAQYEAALAAGTVNENELYMTEESNVDLTDFALKPTITTATLLAYKGDSTAKTYSFEFDYPSTIYDIEVEIDGDNCTDEQLEAWIAAKPLSSSMNKINAKGDVPTIDIPIILTVIPKVVPISFTIESGTYLAGEGTTWEEWAQEGHYVEVSMLKIGVDGTVYVDDGAGAIGYVSLNSIKVNKADKIIKNASYNLID